MTNMPDTSRPKVGKHFFKALGLVYSHKNEEILLKMFETALRKDQLEVRAELCRTLQAATGIPQLVQVLRSLSAAEQLRNALLAVIRQREEAVKLLPVVEMGIKAAEEHGDEEMLMKLKEFYDDHVRDLVPTS